MMLNTSLRLAVVPSVVRNLPSLPACEGKLSLASIAAFTAALLGYFVVLVSRVCEMFAISCLASNRVSVLSICSRVSSICVRDTWSINSNGSPVLPIFNDFMPAVYLFLDEFYG